jgi:hypothetical protein
VASRLRAWHRGAAAAAAKRSCAFSTPDNNVTIETKNRYGNVIRVKLIASEYFSWSLENPGAKKSIIIGICKMATKLNTTRMVDNIDIVLPAKICALIDP